MLGHEKPHCKDCIHFEECANSQKEQDIVCHSYKIQGEEYGER